MKVVIRGDRCTGKSTLLARLQNLPHAQVAPDTGEIQVANISWRYKSSATVVKVEVWDVVDEGKPKEKAPATSLKLHGVDVPDVGELTLDARFVNVYQGAHGVVMMLDITKKWTFQYVERELPKVPPGLPVLVLVSATFLAARSGGGGGATGGIGGVGAIGRGGWPSA